MRAHYQHVSMHAKRVSVSSRGPSMNSRRSSINSINSSSHTFPPIKTQPHPSLLTGRQSDASRKSWTRGAGTPVGERGDFSSRSSSVRSFTMTPITPLARSRKRHSEDRSSTNPDGLITAGTSRQAPSPSQYHRRVGSNLSTDVVRPMKIVLTMLAPTIKSFI